MTVMERRQRLPGRSPRNIGVFVATCAVHAVAIHWLATQAVNNGDSLWRTLEVSFIPTAKPQEPPPPAPVPVMLSDAFLERQLLDIPPPTADLSLEQEPSQAIHAPPPEPVLQPTSTPEEGLGYGPLTKPRVISGPRFPEDYYPRSSIRHKESGTTVVKLCISAAGEVESVEVAESSGYTRLDQAAVDMGWGYMFSPAMREGTSVPVCLPYAIKFRLAIGGARRGR